MRAAKYAGVPWPQFRVLDRETQGQIVAFYEDDTKLEYLEHHEAMKEARRKSRTGRSRV